MDDPTHPNLCCRPVVGLGYSGHRFIVQHGLWLVIRPQRRVGLIRDSQLLAPSNRRIVMKSDVHLCLVDGRYDGGVGDHVIQMLHAKVRYTFIAVQTPQWTDNSIVRIVKRIPQSKQRGEIGDRAKKGKGGSRSEREEIMCARW